MDEMIQWGGEKACFVFILRGDMKAQMLIEDS